MQNQTPRNGAHSGSGNTQSGLITDPSLITQSFFEDLGPGGLPSGRGGPPRSDQIEEVEIPRESLERNLNHNFGLNEQSRSLHTRSGGASMQASLPWNLHPPPPGPHVEAEEFLRSSGGDVLGQVPGGSREEPMSTGSYHLDHGGDAGSHHMSHSIPSVGLSSRSCPSDEHQGNIADSAMGQTWLSFGRGMSGSSSSMTQ